MAKGRRCFPILREREVCTLQKAETVLSIIQERGKRGLALSKIAAIIELLRYERYRWTPVRRIYIEKKRSKKLRPLGMPSWSDKLLQEVLRLILWAYYEPQFSSHSHGFRPDRGCHTALSEGYHQWVGTTYFVEGDIAACFDSLDHTVMMSILRKKIQDGRFLRLIETLLAAGYLEDWRYHQTLSGCPQGSILSPVLANVYLDQLDTFVETVLIPRYNKGERRKLNTAYTRVQGEAQRAICGQGNGRRQKPCASANSTFLVMTPQTPT